MAPRDMQHDSQAAEGSLGLSSASTYKAVHWACAAGLLVPTWHISFTSQDLTLTGTGLSEALRVGMQPLQSLSRCCIAAECLVSHSRLFL